MYKRGRGEVASRRSEDGGTGCRVDRIAHASPKVSVQRDVSLRCLQATRKGPRNSLSPE